jgi:Protein of unknown function (DUF2500)
VFPDDVSGKPLLAAMAGVAIVVIVARDTRWGVVLVPYGLAALLLCAVVAILYAAIVVGCTRWANRFGPVRTVPARVVRKSTQSQDFGLPAADPLGSADGLSEGGALYTAWSFWVTFEVSGKEVDFRLPEKLYVELEEGMEGLLTHRGERLLRFRLGNIDSGPPGPFRQTPAIRDERTPWTEGPRVERKG